MINNKVRGSLENLEKYCLANKYKGYDPFDGLNSMLFQKTVFKRSRFLRLCWLQFFKRSPLNFRKLVKVEKSHNPKAIALFLLGYINIYEINPSDKILVKIKHFTKMLIDLKSEGYSGACWGYNFDWQARAFFQPKFTPTVVATSFVIESLHASNKILKDPVIKNLIISSSKFVMQDLNRTFDENGNFTLSYSPKDKTQVFNAGLLGAKTLSLIYSIKKDKRYLDFSKSIIKYVCDNQNQDGSWAYSKLSYHQWIDSFHTGYNLECIYTYQIISGDSSFNNNFLKGFKFYLDNFFTLDGKPKYYHNKIYPIDIHSPAQFIITLHKTGLFNDNKDLIDKVLEWTIDNMQSTKGYFFYQKKKNITIKIPYMRWTQAWMFLSLTYYIKNLNEQS